MLGMPPVGPAMNAVTLQPQIRDNCPCPGTQVEGQGFIHVFSAEELRLPAQCTRPFDSL